jgi:hypothetical protein
MKERESIRLLKEAGQPKPWTNDEILQNFRFTNVRRMDDKVSRWLLENWYRPNFNHKNMLLACCLARFFNWPPILEHIGFPKRWEPKLLKSKLRAAKMGGEQLFNGAYMVRGNDGVDKVATVIDYTIQPLVDDRPKLNFDSMQESWEVLSGRYGFGSFMAGQVLADMRWAVGGRWADAGVWAAMGPGSKRGLNRLYDEDPRSAMSREEFEGRLEWMMGECGERLPKTLTARLEAIDFQNCCCEWDKYERTLFDGRRPKSRYDGEG